MDSLNDIAENPDMSLVELSVLDDTKYINEAFVSIEKVMSEFDNFGECGKRDIRNCVVISKKESRSTGSTQKDTLLYIVNFSQDMGYAIVSAKKSTPVSVLAIIDEGNYDSEAAENEEMNMFLKLAVNYVEQNENRIAPLIQRRYTTDTTSYVYPPVLTVQWGQKWPENKYFNNGIAGCSNVASAMIMSYFMQPQSINLTYSNADVSFQTLDWLEMKKHIRGQTLLNACVFCSTTDEWHKALGRLCRQIAELNSSVYESGRTYTNQDSTRNALEALGYTCSPYNAYSDSFVETSLRDGKLVYMSGVGTENGQQKGHSWVIDGCYGQRVLNTWWEKREGERWEIVRSELIQTHYNHINWGNNGKSNGYFNGSVFAPAHPVELDPECSLYNSTINYNTYRRVFSVCW